MSLAIEPNSSGSGLTRRKFLHLGVLGVTGMATASCIAGISTRNDIEMTERTIKIPNLPEAFKGTTIAFTSDIHSGPYMSAEGLREVVAAINSVKADMILIPGDFVSMHRNEIPAIAETFHELSAPMGVFATTGNHEFYVDADMTTACLESCGLKVLRNENVALERNGEKLYILGVDDVDADTIANFVEGKTASHIDELFRGVPDNAATILLNHKPYRFDEYAMTNVGLMLSGHTHGGQIVFARLAGETIALSRIASKYVAGLYEIEENGKHTQMYVSRGIGTTALPMRLNCPPEITRITLA